MKTRKTIWMAATALSVLCGGCSRPNSEPVANTATAMSPTPHEPTPNLKRDAELLLEATTKAAEARKREEIEAAAKAASDSPVATSPVQTTPY